MSTSSNHIPKTQEELEAEWVLVQQAQQQPRAFGPLYRRYHEPIFRFIYKRTGDESLSADLCSQVFLKAMQNLGSYEFRGLPFGAWLYRLASNEIAQFFRKNRRHRVVHIEEEQLQLLQDEMEVDDKIGLEFRYKQMQEIIEQLKVEEVQLLELRFFESRPFKEVGDILDITENNAKVKVYRLLQKMKKMLKKLA